jgi:hypothetical protein
LGHQPSRDDPAVEREVERPPPADVGEPRPAHVERQEADVRLGVSTKLAGALLRSVTPTAAPVIRTGARWGPDVSANPSLVHRRWADTRARGRSAPRASSSATPARPVCAAASQRSNTATRTR